MKLFHSVFILSLTIALSCHAADQSPKAMNPEAYIIKYEAALATQNWKNVAPLMHPDCTVTFSDGTLHQGKEEVEKAFTQNFTLIESESYAISKVHWIVKTDEFAVFTFVYDWSGLMGGKLVSGSGRGTSSLVKENGTWLLTTEHLGPKSGD